MEVPTARLYLLDKPAFRDGFITQHFVGTNIVAERCEK